MNNVNEKRFIPGIDVGNRVKVTRNGENSMTGRVVRNDEMSFEVERDDIPANLEYANPYGSRQELWVQHTAFNLQLFGSGNEDIKVEKIA